MATLCSIEAGVDGWVTLTLIPPVTRLKCIVWVLSLFLGSIDARTWRGYRLYGPRPPDGPHWQFQSGDGADVQSHLLPASVFAAVFRCSSASGVTTSEAPWGKLFLGDPTDFSERELTLMYARPSVVCLSVVCSVRAPYSVGWKFRQCFYVIWYLGHLLTSMKNFTEIVPGEPLRQSG